MKFKRFTWSWKWNYIDQKNNFSKMLWKTIKMNKSWSKI